LFPCGDNVDADFETSFFKGTNSGIRIKRSDIGVCDQSQMSYLNARLDSQLSYSVEGSVLDMDFV
jgi:hypothetical protein